MLIVKAFLLYLLVGMLFCAWAFFKVCKDRPEGYENTIRRWNRFSLYDRFVMMSSIALKWPKHVYDDIACRVHCWVTERRFRKISEELERRKEKES